jgi:hypothetical protein
MIWPSPNGHLHYTLSGVDSVATTVPLIKYIIVITSEP